MGDRSCATAHASTLDRSAHRSEASLQQSLLRLQRQYGNNYVGKVLRRASANSSDFGNLDSVERSIDRARGGGQGLDHTVRRQMETSIGADFSGVRIHHDAHADALSQAVSARAFTTGKDIFFRQGEYSPGTSSGRELLAHELTHVVQQNGTGIHRKMSVSEPGDPQEMEADAVARAVMEAERQPGKDENAGIQRQGTPEEEEEEKKKIPGT